MKNDIHLHYTGQFSKAADVGEHWHNAIEVIYLLSGECVSHFDANLPLTAKEGMFFVIPPNILHDQLGKCKTLYMVFDLPADEVPSEAELVDSRNDPFLREWLLSLDRLSHAKVTPEANALARAIWIRINSIRQKQSLAHATHEPPYLEKAKNFISVHYSGPLNASKIARAAGISKSHLDLLFRKRFSKSTISYLNDYRMEIAKHLLQVSYLNISEVAAHCGFSNANYFSRAFKRYHGITPSVFRKRFK